MLTLIKNGDIHTPKSTGMGHAVIAGEQIVYLGSDLPTLPSSLLAEVIDVATIGVHWCQLPGSFR